MSLRGPPGDRTPHDRLEFGVINLDKPPGPTSHQVADWVSSACTEAIHDSTSDGGGEIAVAHAGTLDPKVTGCLPLLLGDATRMAQVFDESVKEYVAVLELHGPAPTDTESVIAEFEGDIYQKPPRKSAVKRQLRTRKIHEIELLDTLDRQLLLRVRCAAGTYIRKLCHDIGLALGVGAHMGDLRRTATGQFDDSALITMEAVVDALAEWLEHDDDSPLRTVVQPAEVALSRLPRIYIAPSAAKEVASGAPVYAPGVIRASSARDGCAEPTKGSLVACFTPDDAAVCLGRLVGDVDADDGTVVELERVLV